MVIHGISKSGCAGVGSRNDIVEIMYLAHFKGDGEFNCNPGQ